MPSHEPTEMRLIAVPSGQMRYGREISTRDVIMVPDLFCKPSDLSIYEKVKDFFGSATGIRPSLVLGSRILLVKACSFFEEI